MKTFALIFTCLSCAFNTVQATSVVPVFQNIQREYEIANDVSKKFQMGILTKELAQELLVSTYTDYSHPEGKEASIAHFITSTTGLENPIISASSEQRGWSGNDIYAIHSEASSEPVLFVKIFPYDSRHYLPEFFGLALLSEVNEVGSPKICALGQCIIHDKRFFLILETPVSGISIQQYFSRVGQHSLDSEERKEAFVELCEAVEASGKGLARLHGYIPAQRKPFPKDYENSTRLDLADAITELQNQPAEGIEIEKLQGYSELVLENMKSSDRLVGLAFDDVKTIHTFYDLISKRFSFVNPHRIYLSFNQDGEVQGLLIKDVCKFMLSLSLNRFEYALDEYQKVYRKELLTENEANIVKNVFLIGYEQGGGTLPTLIEKEYVSLQHHLFFIKNRSRNFPEPELTRVRELINISLENLKVRLNTIN